MKQTKRASLIESITSTAVGFAVSLVILEGVNRVWGLSLGLGDNLLITSIFTAASVARSYLVRRFFNWWHHRGEQQNEWVQALEAQSGQAEPGQYVRIPKGMSMIEAMRLMEEFERRNAFNSGLDISDILNEENTVRPVG